MKKKILPSFELLKLIKGSSRYYIQVKADLKSGGQRMFRNTYNLNRILNLPERINRGEELIRKIRFWLEQGNYYEDFDERLVTLEMKILSQRPKTPLLKDLIFRIRDQKMAETNRRSSVRSHQSHARQFLDFLEMKKWEFMTVDEFSVEHARTYVAYWVKMGISNNNTYNTKLTYIKSYFNYFVDADYIDRNPFGKIKPRRKTKAKREHISKEDMVILGKLAKEKNVWLWVAIQLAFWGLIRQEELTRLKFKMFDVKKWCIYLSSEETKNLKEDIITLPTFLRDQFRDFGFFHFPANYYLFGADLRPGLTRLGERKFHKRFLTVINRAIKNKLIDNKQGLSFSSWRRTGMDYFSHRLTPRKFKDHNRHDNFSTTEHYLPNRKFIEEVSLMRNDVFS